MMLGPAPAQQTRRVVGALHFYWTEHNGFDFVAGLLGYSRFFTYERLEAAPIYRSASGLPERDTGLGELGLPRLRSSPASPVCR